MKTTKTRKPPRLCYRAFEFRSVDTEHGDGRTLEGYAATFNAPTRIDSWEGEFDEQIAPGAFKRTLNARTPVLQFDHGHDARTGSVPIGRIDEISEDHHGLFVRARLFDNDVVKPIRQAIEGGAIDGMSFRFRVVDDRWDDGADIDMRTIKEVELMELGPVVFPAYDSTSVGVRSLLAHLEPDQRARLIDELRESEAPRDTTTESTEDPTRVESDEDVENNNPNESNDVGSAEKRHSTPQAWEPASDWYLPPST